MVRKANKSLKDWVNFVKKVQKEEGLSYRDAMMRAKTRKNKGEKWMTGGTSVPAAPVPPVPPAHPVSPPAAPPAGPPPGTPAGPVPKSGGKKQRKTAKQQGGRRRKTCKQQ